MDKKILIGSIIAVVIIVLAGFTSVVGFQSTKSNSVKISPLFGIRTKRAIDKKSKDTLTSDYVGKGEKIRIPLPVIDTDSILFQRFINKISLMNDGEFHQFKEIIKRIEHEEHTISNEELVKVLDDIRRNPHQYGNLNLVKVPSIDIWFPGCSIVQFILLILEASIGLLYLLSFNFYCPQPPPTGFC